ncbi:unnamed protein product [Anisakis simplex]|uniref:Abhydro_lipase domain-containing protein n=1 Tax=Anisakis simplex TaxID=6269 RepID=A0A0M3J6P3_ANISI|nr:unnamed protein product [Anisakis simplex]
MEIIAYYGYPAELVDVKTDDGYFLQMHRIPHGKNGWLCLTLYKF